MSVNALPNFRDLDEPLVFDELFNALKQVNTLNFVVEFDDTRAHAALNLEADALAKYLQSERKSATSTRWINIFSPEKQIRSIATIARQYDLSPRLQGIISSKPSSPRFATSSTTLGNPAEKSNGAKGMTHGTSRSDVQAKAAPSEDIEETDHDLDPVGDANQLDLNHYRLVDDVWHYFSIDYSRRCISVGYNSLSAFAADGQPSQIQHKSADGKSLGQSIKTKPDGKRIWTWLLLCEDSTVISIHESPFPQCKDPLAPSQQRELMLVRRNLLNVFRQLSKSMRKWRENHPINTLDIRPGFSAERDTDVKLSDSPGLLFYYLFDDWYESYALVARRGNSYAKVLDGLREKMFQRAVVERIEELHGTGRQLAVLKRMYQSYAQIISRILDRQKLPTDAEVPSQQDLLAIAQKSGVASDATIMTLKGGALLTHKARAKFERLRDRIQLYALSEIQECIDEKESLVFLNFNLITMRQSEAVEKLTRITILLAKATMLFLPVSLITGYFSTQLRGLEDKYTITTYWVCFAVAIFITFILLMAFGVISHTLEGGLIYKSFTDLLLTPFRQRYRKRKGTRSA